MNDKNFTKDIDAALANRTRNLSMKWVEIGEGRDPEFNQNYFLVRSGKYFDCGELKSIESTDKGKVYKFDIGMTIAQTGEQDTIDRLVVTDVTHYCLPVIPK